MKNILLTIFALLYLNSGFCENTDSNAETKVNQQVYEQLTKENFVKLNKITREGKLAACELEFQYAYKDFRIKQLFFCKFREPVGESFSTGLVSRMTLFWLVPQLGRR